MTIREWIEAAPPAIREELQSVIVMNFLREHRNTRFQMIGCYDGSMSEECKQICRAAYEALDQLILALDASRIPPKPYNPYSDKENLR